MPNRYLILLSESLKAISFIILSIIKKNLEEGLKGLPHPQYE